MKKDIVNRVTRFYEERLTFYNSLMEEGLKKAKENADIANMDARLKEIKLLALQGKLTPEIDKEYSTLFKEYKDRVKSYLPNIKYECPICKDKGVVDNKYCKCFINRYTEELKKSAGIDSLPTFTFEDNKIDAYDISDEDLDKYNKVYERLERFANNYPNDTKYNIFLKGQSGCGKSCLVSAIANRLIERGLSVQYVTSFDLGEMMLQSHLDYKNNSLNIITNTDVLIIDDLGTEPIRKNINQTYLQSIIDSRIAHHKATIVTTNLNAEQLMNKYGERIISRLINKTDTLSIDFGTLPNLRTIKKSR